MKVFFTFSFPASADEPPADMELAMIEDPCSG
jgi:hypothetical protein